MRSNFSLVLLFLTSCIIILNFFFVVGGFRFLYTESYSFTFYFVTLYVTKKVSLSDLQRLGLETRFVHVIARKWYLFLFFLCAPPRVI